MLIATIPSGTLELVNKEIESSVQKLFFDVTFPFVPLTYMDEDMAAVKAAILRTLGTSVLTVSREDGSVTEENIRKILLSALSEFSANNDGQIRVDINATETRVRFTIELSNSGAFKLDDNSKVTINLSGKVATSVVKIYTLDYPVPATDQLRYETKALDAGVPKDIDTTMSSVLALPAEQVDGLKIFYNNGKQVVLTLDELKQQMFDAQEAVAMCNGRIFQGYMNHIMLNVELCWKVEVTLTASVNIYVLKVIPV